jgi:PhzF family phenazine biosynthesis protein
MTDYRVYQVDSFTDRPFTGNPAGVVANAEGLSDAAMQAIARELNNSETAFILPASGDSHDLYVRFFTPTTEVPSCGHATIAAHHVLAEEAGRNAGSLVQKVGAGLQRVDVVQEEGARRYVIRQGCPRFDPPFDADNKIRIWSALGLDACDVDLELPVQIVSTGHSKIMVPIRSRRRLDALAPNLDALRRLSFELGCNGYHVFSLSDENDPGIAAHGRMFAPAIGIAEDPVTGNANGPMGAWLVRHGLVSVPDGANQVRILARQGEAMGRAGTVVVDVALDKKQPTDVRVGGQAVTIFEAMLKGF